MAGEAWRTLCEQQIIEKSRKIGDVTWEVDASFGANQGPIVAEVEVQSEDQNFDKPDWVGDEVTDDARYSNANLIAKPYTAW